MEAKHTSGPWRATPGNSQMSDPGTTVYHRGQWGVYSDADSHGHPVTPPPCTGQRTRDAMH